MPFVFNPQGLEEFGATHPGFAPLKRVAYAPLQTAVRVCARAADLVIATDRALVPMVHKHLAIDARAIEVIPNAVDVQALDGSAAGQNREHLRAAHGIDAETTLLLSVGRLEANKGFQVLARALGMLQQRDPLPTASRRWRWVLVGEGPYRPMVEAAAAEARLAARIIMPGRVTDLQLRAWYAAADVFVHPTLYEGSSLVTLEAMAYRIPVVATRAGGLQDKVVPGVTGWLVEPGDADGLADALDEAIEASASGRATPMGQAGRALVEREFSSTTAIDRLIEAYRRLMPARRGSSGS